MNKIIVHTPQNEISKTYFANLDYENKNLNSYTMSILNNKYTNNYQSYSGKEKKYSFSLDGKISYVKRKLLLNSFRYSPLFAIIYFSVYPQLNCSALK